MQLIVSVEKISERYLLPALEQLLDSLPFIIHGFHSDNGSEYINHQVAGLLEKLRIELTKSRSRQTNDNALVESKNGSTVRKHLGYGHIPGRYAQQVNEFTLNFQVKRASPASSAPASSAPAAAKPGASAPAKAAASGAKA